MVYKKAWSKEDIASRLKRVFFSKLMTILYLKSKRFIVQLLLINNIDFYTKNKQQSNNRSRVYTKVPVEEARIQAFQESYTFQCEFFSVGLQVTST